MTINGGHEDTAGDECIGCSHSLASHAMRDGSCQYCNCPEFKVATPEKPPREGGCSEVCPERMIARGMRCEKNAGHDGLHFADRRGVGGSHWHGANDGDERPLVSFGWWESLNDWALYSDFPARGQKIAEVVLEAEEYRWRALDGAGGIFGAGGSATLEDAKANAERMCRVRGTMPAKMGERAEEPQAPPAWLTAAVLAALPTSGEAFSLFEIAGRLPRLPESTSAGTLAAALAHLVSTGEIEAGPEAGTWRRWGVPEGCGAWDDPINGIALLYAADKPRAHACARAEEDGTWLVYPGNGERALAKGTATPPTLAAARTAALRACWERGVFGPVAAAPTVILDAPSQPAGMGEQRAIAAAVAGAAPSDRPAALRAALLTVLTRGPVEGLARLLPALDAAMGEAPGVARVTGVEARQAAREVGAEVDGARWSLPAMVTGWGWCLSLVPHCWFLTRLDADDVEGGAVAVVAAAPVWGWRLLPGGEPEWVSTVEEAHAAALAAARRAGLFAPRSAAAVDVTGVGSPAVLPAVTAKDGSPIVYPAPNGPLDAAVLAILATASPAEITAHLAAWGAMLVEQARAPRHTIEAIGDQIGTVTARRVHGEDGEVVSMPHLTDSASVQAQAAAILQRDTIDPAWGALEARATTAEVNATHWQARAEQAERAAAEARLEAEVAADARNALARDYAAERALSESLRAQLDEAETARDDARAALSDLRAALADLAARWAGGAA